MAQRKCYHCHTELSPPHTVTSHHQHRVSPGRLCRLQGTVNRYSGVAQENMQLLSLFPFNHRSRQTLTSTFPPFLPFLPFAPRLYNIPSTYRRVGQCLENGIRRKLFLLIRHLSARAASSALNLESCHGLYKLISLSDPSPSKSIPPRLCLIIF